MVSERYEEVVLCAALLDDPKQYPKVRHVSAEWFDSVEYRRVWIALVWLLDRTPDLSPAGLADQSRQTLTHHGFLDAAAKVTMLGTVYGGTGANAVSAARALGQYVRDEHLRSAVLRANHIVVSDTSVPEKEQMLGTLWRGVLDQADGERELDLTITDVPSMLDERTADGYDWIIPGLLERQERLMLIAPEKAGKSVLSRQVALMLAVGQHPFCQKQSVPVMRTLIVDLENPRTVLRRDMRRQTSALGDMWSSGNQHVHVMHRPGGIHLGSPHDEHLLTAAVSTLRPDLLVISPIYKAYDQLEQSWEEQAFGVQKPLDRLRERFNCAIWMEHHAPWGERGKTREIRPFGSSRWSRWLDYQAMLTPTGEPHRVQWHAVQRDERKLRPSGLRRGKNPEPSWVPEWDDNADGNGFGLAMDVAMGRATEPERNKG